MIGIIVMSLSTMAGVPAMHEEVHQRAKEQQHERQRTVEMRGMFGDEEERCDTQEGDQGQPGSRPEEIKCSGGSLGRHLVYPTLGPDWASVRAASLSWSAKSPSTGSLNWAPPRTSLASLSRFMTKATQ